MHLGKDMNDILINKFVEEDWEIYKRLRLESLKDAPESFGSTYERELNFTEEEWKSRIKSNIEPAHILSLVAVSRSVAVGLASGVVHTLESDTVHIYQMWVSKENRSNGIGRALLSRIEIWANTLKLKSLSLAVTISNSEAISLYKSAGFVSRGSPEPLRKNSELLVQHMVLELERSNA